MISVNLRITLFIVSSSEAGALPLSRLAPNFKELEPPAVGRLPEIHAPTLVILGEKDTSDIHAIGKLLHEQVPGSELVMIPDVGHTLVMEKPSEFKTLVEHFLPMQKLGVADETILSPTN